MSQQMLWNFDTAISPDDVLVAVPRQGRWTRLMASRAMRRAKSPSVVAAIAELVDRNWVSVEMVTLPNGVDMYTYELTDLGRWERGQILADGKLG